MNNEERLLQIISTLDEYVAQLHLDGMHDAANTARDIAAELYWLYHDMYKEGEIVV